MNPNDGGPPDEERALEFLVSRFPPGGAGSDPGDCPEASLLAGLADGTLLPEERHALVRHLAGCEACRRIASELVRGAAGEKERPFGDRSPRRRRITWPRMAHAAAALVALLGAAWWLRPIREAPASTESLLRGVAEGLGAERPALFAGFRPLTGKELGARPPVSRGDIALGFPAGELLERRPVFQWRPAPGVTEWRVTLRRQEGNRLWAASSRESTLPYPSNRPELEPGGKYLWEVVGKGPLGTVEGAQAFAVATEEGRLRFEDARGEIERVADRRLVPLVIAHYAIRRGLLGQAERAARAAWDSDADDPIVRETLVYVLRQLRSPDIDWVQMRKGRSIEED